MPKLPDFRNRVSLPQANPQFATADDFGAQVFERIGDFGETLAKIQTAADVAQSDQVAAEYKAKIINTIKQKSLEIQDPDQFAVESDKALQELSQATLKPLNKNVQNRVVQKTSGAMADALGDIKYRAAEKKIGIAKGNSKLFLEQKERELIDAITPEDRAKRLSEIDEHLLDATAVNVYDPKDMVAIRQGIIERDAFIRAKRKLDISLTPEKDYAALAQEFPNLDRLKLANELNSLMSTRRSEMDRIQKEAEKKVKEQLLTEDFLRATSGQMTPIDYTATVKARRYTIEEANKLKAAMEEGGATDPNSFTRLETAILEGRLRDQAAIAARKDLGRNDKSNLMRLIESQIRQDRADATSQHYVNKQPYQQAIRELRAHISGKGESTPLTDRENIRYRFGLTQIYERVGKGEDPIAVVEELKSRMPTQGQGATGLPIMPKYLSDQELINARRRGVPERLIAQEAEVLLQFQKYQQETVRRAGEPSGGKQR